MAIAVVSIAGLLLVVAVGGLLFMAARPTTADADDGVNPTEVTKRKADGMEARIPDSVGDYARKSKKQAEVQGATSAIAATYEKAGAELEVTLSVFDDSSDAHRHLLVTAEKLQSGGGVAREIRPINDESGAVIGQAVHFASDPELLAYRVDDEVTVIRGPKGDVMPFFEVLPNN